MSEQDKPLPSGLHHMPDVKPAPPVGTVRLPESEQEARLMMRLACFWLESNGKTVVAPAQRINVWKLVH